MTFSIWGFRGATTWGEQPQGKALGNLTGLKAILIALQDSSESKTGKVSLK
jgi:hypothetical protein